MYKIRINIAFASGLFPQSKNGFKLEHSNPDRWVIKGLDKEVRKRGFTYAILHVTFGPTEQKFCNFKVVINSQNAEDGSDHNKRNHENTLLLPRKDVPEEYREELFLDRTASSTRETISTTSPASTTTVPEKRWAFPPGDKKVFEFMNN